MAGKLPADEVHKRVALLIGSPVFGLTGPKNDVESMSNILMEHDFEIRPCVGAHATREGIMSLWNELIDDVSSEDVVVVYYSGHGGQVKAAKSQKKYKFIVPFDFFDSTSDDFRGILDIEIKDLIRKTTDKTENVTLIFDYCHSSRRAWDPWHGSYATQKSLSGIKTCDLSKQEDRTQDTEPVQGTAFAEGNPYALEIFATGPAESAWEYTDEENKPAGAFTRSFAIALAQGIPNRITWRSLLIRVRELVASRFPGQRPWADGPFDRILFATDTKKFDWVPVLTFGNAGLIQGGRESGVKEGSLYTIMSAAYEEANDLEKLGEASVTRVRSPASHIEVSRTPESSRVPSAESHPILGVSRLFSTQTRAFLKKESPYKWPVRISGNISGLEERIKESDYIRIQEGSVDSDNLIDFRQHEAGISGFTGKDTMCISSKDVEDAVRKAEQLANAQDLLTITGGYGKNSLEHGLEIQVQVDSQHQAFYKDGSDFASAGESGGLTLENKGSNDIFVSVFDINVRGQINHLTAESPEGVHLTHGHLWRIDLKVLWPKELPQYGPVPESFIIIVTERPVRWLREPMSGVEDLARRFPLSSGSAFEQDQEVERTPYDVQRISLSLHPNTTNAHSGCLPTSFVAINGNELDLSHRSPDGLFSHSGQKKVSDYILVQTYDYLFKAQLIELRNVGAELQERIADRLYLFYYPDTDLQPIRRMIYVLDAALYPKGIKVRPQLQEISIRDPKSTKNIFIVLHKFASQSNIEVLQEVARIAGLEEKDLKHDRNKILLSIQAGKLSQLSALDGVRTIEEVLKKVVCNNGARIAMNADISINNTPFRGENQIVAVADTGLDNGDIITIHPAFTNRIRQLIPIGRDQQCDDTDGHGTHVCGSVLGNAVTDAQGMTVQGLAPRAKLVLQSLSDRNGELCCDNLEALFLGPYTSYGARIHNNSWGATWKGTQLPYDVLSKEIDKFVWEHDDMLICFAAGNDGEMLAGPTLGCVAAAKNCLTIGAVETKTDESQSPGQRGNRQDGICSFSSRGPTIEKRIKPDVVAPGRHILSAKSTLADNTGVPQPDTFMRCSGTSMATALVSGCAAILCEFFIGKRNERLHAALIKALLINGADSFDNADCAMEGFGRINLENSINPIDNSPTAAGILNGAPLEDRKKERSFSVSNTGHGMTLKVTMVYTDIEGAALQNNLNLIVKAENGVERHGNMGDREGFDNYNNVEQVVWKNVPSTTVKIIVRAVEVVSKPQEFALVWSIIDNGRKVQGG